MKKIDWFSRLAKEVNSRATTTRVVRSLGIAVLMMMVGFASAQDTPKPATPETTAAATPEAPQLDVEYGYLVHHTADLGGHVAGIVGSGSMYDTLVNIHSGPRVFGQSLTLHAVPGSKHVFFDSLTAFSNGFGGDPINFAKLDTSKGKLYEFTGTFRRDRQYFDYDLLANANVPPLSVPYGMVAGVPTAMSLTWQQVNQSPFMFNSVRRMTDTNLTILPISKVTFRIGYSQNIFQGPSMSPGRSIGKNSAYLTEYQRNSSDDFTGGIDWKPLKNTKITFEEFVDHYKADSYFTLAPVDFNAQEADGTPVALGNNDLQTSPKAASTAVSGGVSTVTAATPSPYSVATYATNLTTNVTTTTANQCDPLSMGTAYSNPTGGPNTASYTLFSAPTALGGLPIINPACSVVSSYLRQQPTRTIVPTEVIRFQSSSVKNIAMNGDFRYSVGNTTLANYYENFQGLDIVAASTGATGHPAYGIRSATITGGSYAQRRAVALDYGLTWDVSKTFTLSDQVTFSNIHQPGYASVFSNSTLTTSETTAGLATINNAAGLTTGAAFSISGSPNVGTPLYGYFSDKNITNNATVSWDPSSKATMAVTYRYQDHTINRGSPVSALAVFDIVTQAGIFNATFRPTNKLSMNGYVEVSYNNNAMTPVEARQLNHYRFHALYKPRPWATITGTFNDLERHNNTNNISVGVSADGPLQHVDYTRSASLGVVIAPTEKFSFDANYAFTDVYTSTNICYLNAATPYIAGTASTNAAGGPNLCPNTLTDWGPVKDFMSAPTQFASFGGSYIPSKVVKMGAGYRISAVSGNQFFVQAQEVNGSLQSAYQTPYVNIAVKIHPDWIWRAEYNYYGYGEGGPSGPQFCSTSTTATTAVVPCTSLSLPTGLTESPSGLSAPRNFHANVLTVSMHYEF